MAGRIARQASALAGAIALAALPARRLLGQELPVGCCAPSVAGVAPAPQLRRLPEVAIAPESLRVVRPMSDAERAVVTLATTLSGLTWGLSGAAAGGLTGLATCLARSDDPTSERLSGCQATERWLVVGGMVGTLAGAAGGAQLAARRLGCGAGESRRRAWRGAALGTLVAAPLVAYAASKDPSLLVQAAVVVVVPTLQIGVAARDAGRCRLPVPILH